MKKYRLSAGLWIPFVLALCLTAWPIQASIILQGNPFSSADALGLSPYWDWKTIESENFRVIFPVELSDVANRATHFLEEAHRTLSPLLRWQPAYKTQILIIDNSDSANGLTSPFARIGITLWVTPPENWYSTAYYDDYLRLLIFHEYTHFLNMDATRGYSSIGRLVFGDAFLPNSLWTPWMLEGLAVYMETRFTSSGRGRSPYYEMALRAAVQEGVLNSRSFITLDKVNGTNPYSPGGDTRYQYGYHLMNQITKQQLSRTTADGETQTIKTDDFLGILSERSSERIPFLIDQNLKNIIGKNWSQLWSEMILDTEIRAKKELEIIHSQPTTSSTFLTEEKHEISNTVIGSAASGDGQWLAYTLGSADRRSGLFLRNLHTGITKRLDDKLNGVGMKFTPDSKALIYSEFRQKGIYSTFSDLHAYLLDKNSEHSLTDNARARDPDISPDGQWITFTSSKKAVTGLALAPLSHFNDDYQIGPIESISSTSLYDHAGNPKFSLDAKKIYFTLHRNGKSQEDLMEYDIASKVTSVLLSDGNYNQFPAVDGKGSLYFVSNKTGTYNLFRFQGIAHAPQLVTNMETGIIAPNFRPNTEASESSRSVTFDSGNRNLKSQQYPAQNFRTSLLYACVYSTSGWDLAQINLDNSKTLSTERATIPPPPAPASAIPAVPVNSPDSTPGAPITEYPIQNYSVWPSLLPRAWSPLLGWENNGLTAGAELFGFDAVNRHRYVLAGSYSSQLQTADGYFLYSNRSLGPDLAITGDLLSSLANTTTGSSPTYYRSFDLSVNLSFPIPWTYSTLTPVIAMNLQRVFAYPGYQNNTNFSSNTPSTALPTTSSFDAALEYSNQEYSNLGITSENGRFTELGFRFYNLDTPIWKGLFLDREFIRLSKHVILSPAIKGMWVSNFSQNILFTNAILTGRTAGSILNAFSGDSFSQLNLRGYPNYVYFSKFVSTAGIDLQFPISRIFSGWEVQPVFLKNLYGFTFAEASYFPAFGRDWILPSAGGGLRLSGDFFSILTTTLSIEYHQGFRQDLGGASDFFFQLFLGTTNF